jgi:hypothetical protein
VILLFVAGILCFGLAIHLYGKHFGSNSSDAKSATGKNSTATENTNPPVGLELPLSPKVQRPEAMAQDTRPKAGDVIAGFGAGMPRSGEMPKAGDVLGGFGAGIPNQGAAQAAPHLVAPSPNAPMPSQAASPSTYSIGNVYGNKGIIQQGPNNTVIQAPQPELRGLQSDQIANADGTFTRRYLVEWTAEFPGDWRIMAFGDGVLSISTSAQQFGHSGVRDDHAFTTVNRPHGRYTILVQTRSKGDVELKHEVIR